MSSDQYYRAEGARLRYRDEGAGPAIVLLHGWTLDLDMWNPQTDGLQRHYRLIRLDRRGFGLSSGYPDLRQDVVDVIALCAHLNARPVGCVGMSQGARVALLLAQLEPCWLRCLVLDGPPDVRAGTDSRQDDLDHTGFRALAQTEGLQAFRHEWARHPLTALETGDPGAHQLLERMIARYPGWDLLSTPDTQAHSARDLQPEAITHPGLVLNGELDTLARLRAGEALARSLSRCERVTVPLARHLPNLDNPSAYNSILLHFLCRHLAHRSQQ